MTAAGPMSSQPLLHHQESTQQQQQQQFLHTPHNHLHFTSTHTTSTASAAATQPPPLREYHILQTPPGATRPGPGHASSAYVPSSHPPLLDDGLYGQQQQFINMDNHHHHHLQPHHFGELGAHTPEDATHLADYGSSHMGQFMYLSGGEVSGYQRGPPPGGARAKPKKEKRAMESGGFKPHPSLQTVHTKKNGGVGSISSSGVPTREGGLEAKATVLVLIDDEKVKPFEVELSSKTYPKEHEAFTFAFLRHNEFARNIFIGDRPQATHLLQSAVDLAHLGANPSSLLGVKLLKWYFQEDHLTFPRLCLVYQNRCSSGRNNPWVSKLIRGGPTLRGPVIVLQQKKSPNAETVVFDQYRRDDRHMQAAAASLLPPSFSYNVGSSSAEVTLRSSAPARGTRAQVPPLNIKHSGAVRLSDGASSHQQHPFLSTGSMLSPTAPPYNIATLSSLTISPPTSSPSSSTNSSKASSPASTPPSSVPHSPRGSLSGPGMLFTSAPSVPVRPSMPGMPRATSPMSSSFTSLPINSGKLSGSLSSLPSDHDATSASSTSSSRPPALYLPRHFENDAASAALADQSPAPEVKVPNSRSVEDFSAFSSGFPFPLWSAFPSSSTSETDYPTQTASASRPLSLTSSGIFVPSNRQYKPSISTDAESTTIRPARIFSWEGSLDKVLPPIRNDQPSSELPSVRRASADATVSSGNSRELVDESIIAKLKKIRDTSTGSPKEKITQMCSVYEEYMKNHNDGSKEVADGTSLENKTSIVTSANRKTKLHCRTLIFKSKFTYLSDKCYDTRGDKRSLSRWEKLIQTEVQSMLTEDLIDRHLVDNILLACFIQRRVPIARILIRDIVNQAPMAVSREEWLLLAERYEKFSPALANFIRRLLSGDEKQAIERDTVSDIRVKLKILKRNQESNESSIKDQEILNTVAPISATVIELKRRLWQELNRLATENSDVSTALMPSSMGILYRWSGGEVELEDDDVLQDYLIVAEQSENQSSASAKGSTHYDESSLQVYDVILTERPRLLAFACFPDLDESLAQLREILDSEDRCKFGPVPGSGRSQLYDYLCHHFEYSEYQNCYVVLAERKERKRMREQEMQSNERQKKDVENGYCDQHLKLTNGHGHKQVEHLTKGQESGELPNVNMHTAQNRRLFVRFSVAPTSASEHTASGVKEVVKSWKAANGRTECCAFHLGSLTKEGEEPLYAVFVKNPTWPFIGKRWVFQDWSDSISLFEKHGLGCSTNSAIADETLRSSAMHAKQGFLPSPARYFRGTEDLYLIPHIKLYLNAEHILSNKANRILFDACAFNKNQISAITDTIRYATLEYALSHCRRALRNDPSIATPQSRADTYGTYHLDFLAPLCIQQQRLHKPDLVVVLEKRYNSDGDLSCYIATSLLTPAQAFLNARRVKKIRQTWLLSARPKVGTSLLSNKARRGASRIKSKMNEYDDDEEFQFEQEIDKWVSETEGEEDSEANGDDEAGGSSPTLLDSGSRLVNEAVSQHQEERED